MEEVKNMNSSQKADNRQFSAYRFTYFSIEAVYRDASALDGRPREVLGGAGAET